METNSMKKYKVTVYIVNCFGKSEKLYLYNDKINKKLICFFIYFVLFFIYFVLFFIYFVLFFILFFILYFILFFILFFISTEISQIRQSLSAITPNNRNRELHPLHCSEEEARGSRLDSREEQED